jgi:hypothetical protein
MVACEEYLPSVRDPKYERDAGQSLHPTSHEILSDFAPRVPCVICVSNAALIYVDDPLALEKGINKLLGGSLTLSLLLGLVHHLGSLLHPFESHSKSNFKKSSDLAQ